MNGRQGDRKQVHDRTLTTGVAARGGGGGDPLKQMAGGVDRALAWPTGGQYSRSSSNVYDRLRENVTTTKPKTSPSAYRLRLQLAVVMRDRARRPTVVVIAHVRHDSVSSGHRS